MPVHSGDWTDYWNFGCASTPLEVKISRKAKAFLQKNDFLACLNPKPLSRREKLITEEAYENSLAFDEHTWGSGRSICNYTSENVLSQLNHKKEYAYRAADLPAFLLNRRLDNVANNPWQSKTDEGILIVNPTAVPVQHEIKLKEDYVRINSRRLYAARASFRLPYEEKNLTSLGTVEVPPFSMKKIPFSQLKRLENQKSTAANICVSDDTIDTPFYHITLRSATKLIQQITHKATGRNLVNEDSEWGFFDMVTEKIDERYAPSSGESLHITDVMERYKSVSKWQHDWKAVRSGIDRLIDFHVEENAETITLCYQSEARTKHQIKQRITFSQVHPRIVLDVSFINDPVAEPESVYFTFPLNLHEGWNCVYDTMDTFVKLDEQQLGAMCRDYLTVDKSVSLFDKTGGVTLACPDAPMVQVGDFQFGKENRQIERLENPLLLSWPINNYWSTNFAAYEDGKQSFHYELSFFEKFEEKRAYQAGVQAMQICAQGEMVTCPKAADEELIHFESKTSVPIIIRPQYKEDGWLVDVKNFSCTIFSSSTIV